MIALLGGGIGAARLWRSIARVAGEELVLIVNTGDDIWLHGLRVCPDVDTVLYALSDRQDRQRGWGLAGETFRCMEELRELGSDVWFNLGDHDLATHLLRTAMLRAGKPLSAVTRALAAAMGVEHAVLPMTDDEVTTHVRVDTGELMDYQRYLVARRARPPVLEVLYLGSENARPAEGVLGAIEAARLVVVGPSNPVGSLGPMLSLPGVRRALRDTAAPVVAVTPVVSGKPITGPGERNRARSRAALLASQRVPHSAAGVARWYRDICDVFVVDRADTGEVSAITELGIRVAVADTIVGADDHLGSALAQVVLTAPRTASR